VSLADTLAARTRRTHAFEAGLVTETLAGQQIHVRMPTAEEQEIAFREAHAHVAAVARGLDPSAAKLVLEDRQAGDDTKIACVLGVACREANGDQMFPSGEWLMKHLSTFELAVLSNMLDEVARRESPIDVEMSDERVRALLARLRTVPDVLDLPNYLLVHYTRDQLAELLVRFALMTNDR